ncbi:MAG: antibiotic biosynthesis monooxygenase [Sphingobacteriales bacterium]|nr:MAG: antibiotic biosynthesis monooxygenase [Sphingobacteriales bacterium]
MENQGATVVITHHILEGKQQAYEAWLDEIGPVCRKAAGNIDWQIIRPIPALTFAYTVIIRFDTIDNLKKWMFSGERERLIAQAVPLLAKGDRYDIRSGLDFLFQSGEQPAKVPVRWKQYLATWSAIYPLSLIVPLLVAPLLRKLGVPQVRYIDALFVSGTVVFLMVYVVMPRYTRLLKRWLYR